MPDAETTLQPDHELDRLSREVADLARRAGEAILEVYGTDFEVHVKDDSSPLTAADLASERIILAGLKRLTPEVPVLAEETGNVPYAERRSWRRCWLVDPLDGTREFVKRNGEFTVNIALVEDGKPILGVVHAPVEELSYRAARGSGAYRLGDGRETRIESSPPDGRLRLVMSRSHAGERTRRFVAHLEGEFEVEAVARGSALKMCLVADGSAHLYPRLGPTMEWDVAAAQCIVEEAGAELVTLDGEPMTFNRERLVNEDFLACYGDSGRWLELLTST